MCFKKTLKCSAVCFYIKAQYFYSFKASYEASYEASQMFCFTMQCNQNKTFEEPRMRRHTRPWMSRNTSGLKWNFCPNIQKYVHITSFCSTKTWKNTSTILSAYIMITNGRAAVHWPVLLTLLSSYFWSSLEILQLYWAELPNWARVSPRCLKISIEAALGR